ncbi:MAG: glycosyltransferase family 9 protein [Gemmatimonadetes bacterium]|nr:glycosyltransferase family 9 protein [Gemmatimonadota bacterium]
MRDTPSLVIQTSFLGDVVLTTPLLRRLAARGPVTVVTTAAAAPLLAGHPDVARLVPYDKRGADAGISGFVRLTRSIATNNPDAVAYLAQGSHRSGALARAAGYRTRVGFATSAGRLWYTESIDGLEGWHHAERLWRLGGNDRPPTPGDLQPTLVPSAADVEAAEAMLRGASASAGSLVALAPGSVWGTKRWPHYAELAAALAPRRVAVVGAAADATIAAQVVGRAPNAIDATGKLPLLATAALLARCQAIVTNDSLPLHLASAMNTPTVAIFGPTVPGFGFGPLAARRAIVEHSDMPCRPCHSHGPPTCPLGHFRCMQELTVARVAAAVDEVTA